MLLSWLIDIYFIYSSEANDLALQIAQVVACNERIMSIEGYVHVTLCLWSIIPTVLSIFIYLCFATTL